MNYEEKIEEIKKYLESKDLDYYDFRLEEKELTYIEIENKDVKDIKKEKINGIGIRIYFDKKIGFCSTNKIENYKKIIDECIENTKKITQKTKLENFSKNKAKAIFKYKKFEDKDIEEKVKELKNINSENFSKEYVKNTKLFKKEEVLKKYFVSPYSFIYQETPTSTIANFINLKKENKIESNYQKFANVGGLETYDLKDYNKLINENYVFSKNQMNAKLCPAIKSDVIIDSETSGLLAHEAIGHSSEADAIVLEDSVLRKGQIVSKNKNINLIDDPTLKKHGYFAYDDEGFKSRAKYLIKNGVVNEYLKDIETATTLGEKSNGSARAQSYTHIPIVRMSNTYFKKGIKNNKDLLKDFTGYLLKRPFGGQVDPAVGTFMFGIRQAIKYEKGKVIDNFKQASISGSILKYLNNIQDIGNTYEWEPGYCGKGGQSVNVDDSGPYMKIKDVVIGGSKHE